MFLNQLPSHHVHERDARRVFDRVEGDERLVRSVDIESEPGVRARRVVRAVRFRDEGHDAPHDLGQERASLGVGEVRRGEALANRRDELKTDLVPHRTFSRTVRTSAVKRRPWRRRSPPDAGRTPYTTTTDPRRTDRVRGYPLAPRGRG